jgi:Flp pilus assembly protein TadG
MRKNNERGMVVVMTAILLPVLIFVVGLAVDFGVMYAVRNSAQNAADAAAMAGVYAYAGTDPYNSDYTDAANKASLANPIINGTAVTPSSVTAFRCTDSLGISNYCVTTVVNVTSPIYFARVFGKQPIPIRVTATAQANIGFGYSADCQKPLFIPDTAVAGATPGSTILNFLPTDPKNGQSLTNSTYYALDFSDLLCTTTDNSCVKPVTFSNGQVDTNGGVNTYSDSWQYCVQTALHCGQQVRIQTGAKGNATSKPIQTLITAGQTTFVAPVWGASQQLVNGNSNYATVVGFAQLSNLACVNGGKKGTCNNTSTYNATFVQYLGCSVANVGKETGSYASPVRLIQ